MFRRFWSGRPKLVRLFLLGLLVGGVVGAYFWHKAPADLKERAAKVLRRKPRDVKVSVAVVKPARGPLERKTEQTGTVQAYESADLFAEVSGKLEELKVEPGSPVKKGDLLAVISVPVLEMQVKRCEAALALALSNREVLKQKVEVAKADRDAAFAAVPRAEKALRAANKTLVYRQKQLERTEDLYNRRGLEERLVDEKREQRDAAEFSVGAAEAAWDTAKALREGAKAKVKQAVAERENADAQIKVAVADLGAAKIPVENFARIHSPYTGLITNRTLFRGGFVRAGKEGERTALLSVARLDLVRVVVQLPDRLVRYARKGDLAVVKLDALPGRTFQAPKGGPPCITIIHGEEDPVTRTMRVEVHLDNSKGDLRPHMPGYVQITLEKVSNAQSVELTCLASKPVDGWASVYVVRNGRAVLTRVRIGFDNGERVLVHEGLRDDDEVVIRPPATLAHGKTVEVRDRPASPQPPPSAVSRAR